MLKTLALYLLILAVCCGSFRVSADETIVSKPSAHPERKIVTVCTGTFAEHSHNGKKKPRLWQDEGAAQVVAALSDYTRVYVFRWEHGELHGQAELESGDGSKSLTFDLAPPADFQSDFIGGPHAFPTSGWLAIGMRRLHDNKDEKDEKRAEYSALVDPRLGQKYDVRIEQQFTFVDGSKYQTVAFESRQGTLLEVPPDAKRKQPAMIGGVGDEVSSELHKLLEGRSTPWLKLEVTEFSSQNRINDEQSDEREP